MRNMREQIHLRDDKRLLLQAFRYGIAAFGGFAADYGALLLLKEWAGLHYLVAVPIAFVIGIADNIITHSYSSHFFTLLIAFSEDF